MTHTLIQWDEPSDLIALFMLPEGFPFHQFFIDGEKTLTLLSSMLQNNVLKRLNVKLCFPCGLGYTIVQYKNKFYIPINDLHTIQANEYNKPD